MIHRWILDRFMTERAERVSELGGMSNEAIDTLLADYDGGTNDEVDRTRPASHPREGAG